MLHHAARAHSRGIGDRDGRDGAADHDGGDVVGSALACGVRRREEVSSLSMGLEDLALDPGTSMEQDAGVPLFETRRIKTKIGGANGAGGPDVARDATSEAHATSAASVW